jgi:hypothetical protein
MPWRQLRPGSARRLSPTPDPLPGGAWFGIGGDAARDLFASVEGLAFGPPDRIH